MRHLAWSQQKRRDEGGQAVDSHLETRPLARKKMKLAEPSTEACDWPPALRSTQSQGVLDEVDQPSVGLQEPSVSTYKEDSDWPEVVEDPWAVEDTQEAADFWGVPLSSTESKDSEDCVSSSPSKDELQSDISELQDHSVKKETFSEVNFQPSKSDLVTTEVSQEKTSYELPCVPSKLNPDHISPDSSSEITSKIDQNKSEEQRFPEESKCDDLEGNTKRTTKVSNINVTPSSSQDMPLSMPASAGMDTGEYDDLCLENDDHPDLYVVEDTEESDCEIDDDAEKPWKPVRKREPHQLCEHLLLTFEEAFFLSYGLGSLVILDEDQHPMNLSDMWQTFSSRQSNFIPQYIAYHSLRSKGWVPKEGIKFGVDFLVYRHGPAFYHSSYCVLVRMVDEETLQDTQSLLSWRSLMGLTRTTEGVGKEVMLLYVIRPSNMTEKDLQSPKIIPQFKVKEVVVKRWVSQQEREGQTSLGPDIS